METNNLFSVIVVLALGLVACVSAGSAPPTPEPSNSPSKFKWNVAVGDGDVVSQAGVALTRKPAVFIFTYSRKMKEHNLTASSVIMEFSDPAGVMAVRFGYRWKSICFIVPTSDTIAQVRNDLLTKNGTVITLNETVALNGTDEALSWEDRASLFQNHPVLRQFCRRAKIIETAPMEVGAVDPYTKTLTFLGFDSRLAIMIGGKKPEDKPKPKRGPWWPRKWPRRG